MIDINDIQKHLDAIPGIRNPIPAMSQCTALVKMVSKLSETLLTVPLEAPFNEYIYKQIVQDDFHCITSGYIVLASSLGHRIEDAMFECKPWLIQGAKEGVRQAEIPSNIIQFPKS